MMRYSETEEKMGIKRYERNLIGGSALHLSGNKKVVREDFRSIDMCAIADEFNSHGDSFVYISWKDAWEIEHRIVIATATGIKRIFSAGLQRKHNKVLFTDKGLLDVRTAFNPVYFAYEHVEDFAEMYAKLCRRELSVYELDCTGIK